MTTLHLGVNDIPYSWYVQGEKSKSPSGKTTGDIADLLERHYKLMETFVQLRERNISEAVENSLHGSLETVLMGGPMTGRGQAYAKAMTDIEDLFKNDLSMRAFDGKILGVPTKAARKGVSHRFKHPYAKRPARPSFIDTGQFQSSFRAWVD